MKTEVYSPRIHHVVPFQLLQRFLELGPLILFAARNQVYKYDVSLPLQRMYELVEETRVKLQAAGVEARVVYCCKMAKPLNPWVSPHFSQQLDFHIVRLQRERHSVSGKQVRI